MNIYTTSAPRSQTNKNVFNSCLNCTKSISDCRKVLDRLFETPGPATQKLLSPSRILVLRTMQTLALAKRRWQRPAWLAMYWHPPGRRDLASQRDEYQARPLVDPAAHWQPMNIV